MCLSPVLVKSNRKLHVTGVDQEFNYFPCGHCPECLKDKRNEMYVRLYYEYKRYMKSPYNGTVFFVTLTYGQYSLPLVNSFDDEELCALRHYLKVKPAKAFLNSDGETVKVDQFMPYLKLNTFDKRDLRKFLKRLTEREKWPKMFQRQFRQTDLPIKHFCVCEYGHEKQQSHYHVLLFVPFKVDEYLFRHFVKWCWSDKVPMKSLPDYVKKDLPRFRSFIKNGNVAVINSPKGRNEGDFLVYYRKNVQGRFSPVCMRTKGFVSYSKKYGARILGPKGMEYLTKYLFKDAIELTDKQVSEYKQKIENKDPKSEWYKRVLDKDEKYKKWSAFVKSLDAIDSYEVGVRDIVKRVKASLSFSLVSDNFGTGLQDEFDLTDLDSRNKLYKKVISEGVHLPNDVQKYKFPKYIIRRIFQQNRHYVNIETGQRETFSYLSDYGVECAKLRFDYQLKFLSQKFSMMLSEGYLSLLGRIGQIDFEEKFGLSLYSVVSDIRKKFEHDNLLFDSSPYNCLVKYKLLLQNVAIPLDYSGLLYCKDFAVFEDYAEYIFDKKWRKPFDYIDVQGKYFYCIEWDKLYFGTPWNSVKFNSCDMFRKWDMYLDILDWLDTYYKQRCFDNKEFKQNTQSRIRALYNSFIF